MKHEDLLEWIAILEAKQERLQEAIAELRAELEQLKDRYEMSTSVGIER